MMYRRYKGPTTKGKVDKEGGGRKDAHLATEGGAACDNGQIEVSDIGGGWRRGKTG